MNAIIIHGIYSNPSGNWFPWLKKELELEGYAVIVPKFPTPINQTLEKWLEAMGKIRDDISEETVLIGHSLGAAFILSYLEKAPTKIRGVVLVSGFHTPLGIPLDKMNSSFVAKPFDWEGVKAHCGEFVVVCSDDDPYIPLSKSKELARYLSVAPTVIHHGGHLNKEAGYVEFPLLKKIILERFGEK